MQPASGRRPRPPSQRAPSSRLTALPTPSSPRQRSAKGPDSATSATSSSTSAATPWVPPNLSSSRPPDTPPLEVCEFPSQAPALVEASSTEFATSPNSFPTSPTASQSTPRPGHHGCCANASPASPEPDLYDSCGLAQAAIVVEGEDEKNVTNDGSVLNVGSMRRDELGKIVKQADRIIREEEEELRRFTKAGDALPDQYHNLRHRYDSLLRRGDLSSGRGGSALLHSRLSLAAPYDRTVAGSSSDSPTRLWRTSIELPSPTGSTSSTASCRRGSGGCRDALPPGGSAPTGYRTCDDLSQASAPGSPISFGRFEITPSTPESPESSPTRQRRSQRFSSSSSVASLFAPAPRTLFSPKAGGAGSASAQEVERLSLQLADVEAEKELAEKESRRKLRKLEKELQAMREELECSELRNSTLETDRALAKEREKEVKARDRGSGNDSGDETSLVASNTPEKSSARLCLHMSEDAHPPPPDFAPPRLSSPTNLSTSSNRSSPRRKPGNGNSPSRFRTISNTSSLAPLPLPSFDLDPWLDEKQDELVGQLMAKIGELQDAVEVNQQEREEMEERLEVVREELEMARKEVDTAKEEAREWRGKCEELEEQQPRLGWEGRRGAIGWRQDGDAHPLSSTPQRPRSAASSSSSPSHSRDASQMTITNPLPDLKRTLRSELEKLWPVDCQQDQQHADADADDEIDYAQSVVVHSAVSSPEKATRGPSSRSQIIPSTSQLLHVSFTAISPATTSDDFIASGSLRITDPGVYEHLATTAAEVEPAWEDDADNGVQELASRVLEMQGTTLGWATPGMKGQGYFGATKLRAIKSQEAVERRKQGDKLEKAKRKGKAIKTTSRNTSKALLSSIRFGSEEEGNSSHSPELSRRALALRRLGLEASSRHGTSANDWDESDDASSVILSDYDLVDGIDGHKGTDYYPLTLRARYHPRMLATMMTDSAVRHLITMVTWVHLFIVLTVAIGFSLWQGPKKTLGLVAGRRRRIR
ncbi:hypothetical protein JCM21900_000742 [Sporobolomyces salmonicolor]